MGEASRALHLWTRLRGAPWRGIRSMRHASGLDTGDGESSGPTLRESEALSVREEAQKEPEGVPALPQVLRCLPSRGRRAPSNRRDVSLLRTAPGGHQGRWDPVQDLRSLPRESAQALGHHGAGPQAEELAPSSGSRAPRSCAEDQNEMAVPRTLHHLRHPCPGEHQDGETVCDVHSPSRYDTRRSTGSQGAIEAKEEGKTMNASKGDPA